MIERIGNIVGGAVMGLAVFTLVLAGYFDEDSKATARSIVTLFRVKDSIKMKNTKLRLLNAIIRQHLLLNILVEVVSVFNYGQAQVLQSNFKSSI